MPRRIFGHVGLGVAVGAGRVVHEAGLDRGVVLRGAAADRLVGAPLGPAEDGRLPGRRPAADCIGRPAPDRAVGGRAARVDQVDPQAARQRAAGGRRPAPGSRRSPRPRAARCRAARCVPRRGRGRRPRRALSSRSSRWPPWVRTSTVRSAVPPGRQVTPSRSKEATPVRVTSTSGRVGTACRAAGPACLDGPERRPLAAAQRAGPESGEGDAAQRLGADLGADRVRRGMRQADDRQRDHRQRDEHAEQDGGRCGAHGGTLGWRCGGRCCCGPCDW